MYAEVVVRVDVMIIVKQQNVNRGGTQPLDSWSTFRWRVVSLRISPFASTLSER